VPGMVGEAALAAWRYCAASLAQTALCLGASIVNLTQCGACACRRACLHVHLQAAANAHHQLKMANSIVHQRPLLIKLLVCACERGARLFGVRPPSFG
jgi:hypothetical protein